MHAVDQASVAVRRADASGFRPKRPLARERGLGVSESEPLTDPTTMTDHTASVAEANAARLPLGYRDSCSAYVFLHT